MISEQAKKFCESIWDIKRKMNTKPWWEVNYDPSSAPMIRKMIDEQSEGELPDGVAGENIRVNGVDCILFRYNGADKISDRVTVFLHGGAFLQGSVLSRKGPVSQVCLRSRTDLLGVCYRQVPEAVYPGALEDTVTAYKYLLDSGYAPEKITIFGESSGAGLALSVCHYMKDNGIPLPGRIMAFSPIADVMCMRESRFSNTNKDAMLGAPISYDEIVEARKRYFSGIKNWMSWYVNDEQCYSPYVSPVLGNFAGFPETLLVTGECDLYRDDCLALYDKLKADGAPVGLHDWEGMFHSFFLMPYFPEAESATDEIAAFCRGDAICS